MGNVKTARKDGDYFYIEFSNGCSITLTKWQMLKKMSGSQLLKIRQLTGD